MHAPSPVYLCVLLLGLPLLALPPRLAAQEAPPAGPDSLRRDSLRRDSLRRVSVPAAPAMTGQLPPLTVEAAAVSAPGASATTTLSRPARLAGPGQSTARLLAMGTSLFVKQHGAGGRAVASARGLGAAQTLVLVDEHRVADPQTGQTDLSLLPSFLVESVRVLRGSQAARYGSGALGGVVQLRTVQPSASLRVEGSSGMGAYGWRTAGGMVAHKGSTWSGLAAGERTWTDGDFPYTAVTGRAAGPQRRQNAGRQQETAFGRLTRRGSRGTTALRLWGLRAERGLPGTANAPAGNAMQHHRQWRAALSHRYALPAGRVKGTVRLQDSFVRYHNPHPEPQFAQADTARTQRGTVTARARLALGSDLLVNAGASIGHDRAALRHGVHRWRYGAFANAAWTLGAVTLHPGLRLDLDRPSGPGRATTALSPRLGAVWTPGPSWLRLKGRVSRAFRTPTFNERYMVPGGVPSLHAETGWSAEGGVALAWHAPGRRLRTELTAFTTRLDHQIVWQPSFLGPGLQLWRPSNVGRVRTQGLEWTARGRWRVGNAVRLNGQLAFTHVSATDRSAPAARSYGRQLPYRPRQRLKARAGASWRGLRLDVASRWVGPRYITADESQSLSPFHVTTARLQLQRSLGPVRVTGALGVRNLFDATYHVVRLYPMPPRHVRARLTVSLRP